MLYQQLLNISLVIAPHIIDRSFYIYVGSAGAIDRLPLPKCSYINTDFPGDDLLFDGYEKAGINAGSARACKARCNQDEACSFWSYREGDNRDTFTRDCFLKEGTPGSNFSILLTGLAY